MCYTFFWTWTSEYIFWAPKSPIYTPRGNLGFFLICFQHQGKPKRQKEGIVRVVWGGLHVQGTPSSTPPQTSVRGCLEPYIIMHKAEHFVVRGISIAAPIKGFLRYLPFAITRSNTEAFEIWITYILKWRREMSLSKLVIFHILPVSVWIDPIRATRGAFPMVFICCHEQYIFEVFYFFSIYMVMSFTHAIAFLVLLNGPTATIHHRWWNAGRNLQKRERRGESNTAAEGKIVSSRLRPPFFSAYISVLCLFSSSSLTYRRINLINLDD